MCKLLVGSFAAGAVMMLCNWLLTNKRLITTKPMNLLFGYLSFSAGSTAIILYSMPGHDNLYWLVLCFMCWHNGLLLMSWPPAPTPPPEAPKKNEAYRQPPGS